MPVFPSPPANACIGQALDKHRGQILKQRYLDQIKPFPCVRQWLRLMREDGLRIVLASSAKADALAVYKKLAAIDDLVDTETTSDEAKRSKPYPDIFAAALARLDGVDSAHVLVVGDTLYDAQAAAKLGLRTIRVLCGGFPESSLQAAGCIAMYRDPADLLAHYEASPLHQATMTP